MSAKKWFILNEEKVQGPMTSLDILDAIEKGLWKEARFWAKGRPQWLAMSEFRSELQKDTNESRQIQTSESLWYVKENKSEHGPFTNPQLLDFLRNRSNYKEILVTSSPNGKWQEVYHIDSLMEQLGINRRKQARVPIQGKLIFQEGLKRIQNADLVTLSQGGMGVRGLTGLSIGEKIKGTLSSPNIPIPIHCQAEVVFIREGQDVGLKFINLSTEAQTHIIAYVKQFVQAHPDVDFRRVG